MRSMNTTNSVTFNLPPVTSSRQIAISSVAAHERGEHNDQSVMSCPACRVEVGLPSKHADLLEKS